MNFNKAKIITITSILAIVSFVGLIFLQRKLSNYTPTAKVVWVIQKVDKGRLLNTKLDIIEKDVPITWITKDTVRNKEEAENMTTLENIYPNEPLNKNRLIDKNKSLLVFLQPGEREFSIPTKYLDDPVAGTLREGDIADVLCTTLPNAQNPSVTTKTLIQQVRVIGAISQDGQNLDKNNHNIAASIKFAGSPEASAIIKNAMYSGKINIDKVPKDASRYGNIHVEGGKVK